MDTIPNHSTEIIGYGLFEDQLTHISQVDRGLNCGCTCVGCGATLVAKKGDIKSHHFAHYNATDCGIANETVLHRLGKEVIAAHLKLAAPNNDLTLIRTDLTGRPLTFTHPWPAFTLRLAEVQLEKDAGGFRPDITAVTDTGEEMFVEIVVSHPIDPWTLEKVRSQTRPMLSVDLSGCDALADLDTLTETILYSAPRTWLHEIHVEQWREQKELEADQAVAAINSAIRECVKRHFGEETKEPQSALPTPGYGEVLALGYSSATGYSHKNQRPFDISLLKVVAPISNYTTPNYQVRGQGGFEVKDLNFDPALIPELEALQYPCVIKPKFADLFIAGRRRPAVVGLL